MTDRAYDSTSGTGSDPAPGTGSDPGSDPGSGPGAERSSGTPRRPKVRDREARIERGVAIRAGFYIFGTHLFAGFVWLLFYVGEHAHK